MSSRGKRRIHWRRECIGERRPAQLGIAENCLCKLNDEIWRRRACSLPFRPLIERARAQVCSVGLRVIYKLLNMETNFYPVLSGFGSQSSHFHPQAVRRECCIPTIALTTPFFASLDFAASWTPSSQKPTHFVLFLTVASQKVHRHTKKRREHMTLPPHPHLIRTFSTQ